MKLYTASAKVEYDGRKNVRFDFFVTKRESPVVKYKKVIDYKAIGKDKDKRLYAEGFIDECFTKSEIKELRKYLAEIYNEAKLEVKEVKLPFRDQMIIPIGAIPVGGSDGFYKMDTEPGYNLSVPIWAYFHKHSGDLPGGQSYAGEIHNLIRELEEESKALGDLRGSAEKAMASGEVEPLRAARKAIDVYRHSEPSFDEDVTI
jgi:hypothetical protein